MTTLAERAVDESRRRWPHDYTSDRKAKLAKARRAAFRAGVRWAERVIKQVSTWRESDSWHHAESEALRMYPDGLHLGKFDGLMSDAEIDRRMLIQRQAYLQGREHQFKYERGMTI